MTYLEIVNKVLRLMRETSTASINNVDDIVVALTADFVNDAKRTVEDAHNWNMLRHDWDVTVLAGQTETALTGSGKFATIDYIYNDDGQKLQETPNQNIARMLANNTGQGTAWHYAVNGLSGGDLKLRVYPPVSRDTVLSVSGYKAQPDLAIDSDVLLVPHQPVIYLALALAARERGEVGGQTAAELFAMASQYLKDAIANDVSLNQYEYDFYVG